MMFKIIKILTPILIIIVVAFLAIGSTNAISLPKSNVSTDNTSISEEAQLSIWDLCEKNNLNYELVLSIYHVEGITNPTNETIKDDMSKLTTIRDYWSTQGIGDETVYNLTLISWQRGLEVGKSFAENKTVADLEADDFVQKVTVYKYYLEQDSENEVNQ